MEQEEKQWDRLLKIKTRAGMIPMQTSTVIPMSQLRMPC